MALIKKRIHQRILEKKRQLDPYKPFPSDILEKMRKEILVSYTYNSNALEGISLSPQETRKVIEEFYPR